MDSLLRDIRERDARDAGRAAAPLRPAGDAVLLDTTELTIDEVVGRVLSLWQERASASEVARQRKDRESRALAGARPAD